MSHSKYNALLLDAPGRADPLVACVVAQLNHHGLSTANLGQHRVKGLEEKVRSLKGKVESDGAAAFEGLAVAAPSMVEPHLVVGVLKALLREREGGLCGKSSTAICEACLNAVDATVAEQKELALDALRRALRELDEKDRATLMLVLDHMAKVRCGGWLTCVDPSLTTLSCTTMGYDVWQMLISLIEYCR